jgi:hypothetical protein
MANKKMSSQFKGRTTQKNEPHENKYADQAGKTKKKAEGEENGKV